MPLFITAIIATPNIALPTEPRPPERDVPPSTVAAIHFVAVAGRGLAVLQLGCVEHAAQRRHHRAEYVAYKGYPVRIDSTQVSYLYVGAGGVYMPPEYRLAEQGMHYKYAEYYKQRYYGYPARGLIRRLKEPAAAEPGIVVRNAKHGSAA